MNVNPYEAPKSNEPAKTPAIKGRWFLRPLTAPFLGAAIGAAGGALYGIGYFLVNFFGVLEPASFIGETLEAVIFLGVYFGAIGGGIGLVVAPFLWIVDRLEHSGSGK